MSLHYHSDIRYTVVIRHTICVTCVKELSRDGKLNHDINRGKVSSLTPCLTTQNTSVPIIHRLGPLLGVFRSRTRSGDLVL